MEPMRKMKVADFGLQGFSGGGGGWAPENPELKLKNGAGRGGGGGMGDLNPKPALNHKP